MSDQIWDAIDRARTKREREIEVPGTADAPLIGECPANAIALAEELHNEGFDVEIAAGAFKIRQEATPETFREAQRRGQHHFWVIADGMHADISSEIGGRAGDPFVRASAPADYVLYGRVPYTRSLTPSTLNDPDLLSG